MSEPTTSPSAFAELRHLIELVREDYHANGASVLSPGFQSLAIHRFGVWRMSVDSRPLRMPLSLLYKGLYRFACNMYGIELPYTAAVGRRVIFEHQHGIVVHGYASIGDDCIIRHGVTLGIRNLRNRGDAPVLGRNVNVGAGAKILGKVRIGDNAQIGANAVVLNDVPANAVAVGVPAAVVSGSGNGAQRAAVNGLPSSPTLPQLAAQAKAKTAP